ncbi:MAG TPA: class III extradiol ring-cleavage dioxygenase [Polyangia bacterium]|nr:class III extradiol ring-cleavage dioxygenase [Polyangia bacterium]
MPKRMPVAFLPHGGGPVTHVEMGMPRSDVEPLGAYWRGVRDLPPARPKALLVVSAHWEEAVPTVMSSPAPPMYYDYFGFPPEAYQITWPAPGDPELAAHVRALAGRAGFATAEDGERGFDHGTFTPLKQAYPEADLPVVQLSLMASLDAAEHLRLGRALAPLRDEGVFIVGSGDSFHNMRSFGPAAREPSRAFNAWLTEAVTGDVREREKKLAAWESAPAARVCHPREEHLIPLMVVAGAAGADTGTVTWRGEFLGSEQVGWHFG